MQFVRVHTSFENTPEDCQRNSFLSVVRGEALHVEWGESSFSWLWCSRVASKESGWVPASHCRPLEATLEELLVERKEGREEEREPSNAVVSEEDAWWVYDPLEASQEQRGTAGVPPVLTPGLESLVWPLTGDQFVERMWRRRVFCVLGTPDRLTQLFEDFPKEPERLLFEGDGDTPPVIFMKTLTGKIEHVTATPAQALAGFRAGHTVYFNPSVAVQARWLVPLGKLLPGPNVFSLTGKRFPGVGGEIEVFLSSGLHETPFHFDYQESITIQLTGTKRWEILDSPHRDPIRNAQPFIFERSLWYEELKHHGHEFPVPTAEQFKQAKTITLRPGSVLYVPAGVWHRVHAVVDALHAHSLSICLSFPLQRQGDLLSGALLTALASIPEMRLPMSASRDAMDALLAKVKDVVSSLTGDHVIPPALHAEEGGSVISLIDGEFPAAIEALALPRVLERNVASRMVVRPDDCAVSVHTGFVGRSMYSDQEGDVTAIEIRCTPEQHRVCQRYQKSVSVDTEQEEHARLLKALLYAGFFVARKQ